MKEERNAMNGETEEIMTAEKSGGIEDVTVEPAAEKNEVTEDRAEENRDGAEELRAELSRTRERVTQLERERSLLTQGVPEEDLDYYVFKIGKLVSEEKDFEAAAKEFLKQRASERRAAAPRSTGASLAGRPSSPRSTNDTMNRILRGA
jgi:hypothetical protein